MVGFNNPPLWINSYLCVLCVFVVKVKGLH